MLDQGLKKLLDYAHNWGLKGWFKIPSHKLDVIQMCDCECHLPKGVKHIDADEEGGGSQTVCNHCSPNKVLNTL